MSWITVDLPLPDGPTRATVSPSFIVRVRPFRTCKMKSKEGIKIS